MKPLAELDELRALNQRLVQRGYVPYPWAQGFNFGPRARPGPGQGPQHAHQHFQQTQQTQQRHFRRRQHRGHTHRQQAGHGQSVHDEATVAGIRRPPPLPTSSIYSRSDGVVAWHCSVNDPAPLAENIEVHASHMGMGMGLNPLALYAVADRLAPDPAHWLPFDPRGTRRSFYRLTHPTPQEG